MYLLAMGQKTAAQPFDLNSLLVGGAIGAALVLLYYIISRTRSSPGYKRVSRLSSWRRIALSFWNTPTHGMIYGYCTVDATKALAYSDKLFKETGVRVSIGTMAGRSIALAWKETPAFNSKIIWGSIQEKDDVDVYFQADLGGGSDLAGVCIRKAHAKPPLEIAKELAERAKKLRKGEDEQYEKAQKKLLGRLPPFMIRYLMRFLVFLDYNLGLPMKWVGSKSDAFGTVMVSNLQSFGIEHAFAPLATPSRVPAVIVVGSILDKAWVVDGEIKVRPVFLMTAAFDHRLGDGFQTGKLQARAGHYMHNPEEYEESLAAGKGLLPMDFKYKYVSRSPVEALEQTGPIGPASDEQNKDEASEQTLEENTAETPPT